MKPVNAYAQKVLEQLTADLADPSTDGVSSRRIDNSNGTYMSVSVERIGAHTYSVAHYYVQNGDMMRDPEMVFVKGGDGRFYPIYFRQDGIGVERESAGLDEHGAVKWTRPVWQKDQAVFAGTWMRNIVSQQGLRQKVA
jgi:hypothetical protein